MDDKISWQVQTSFWQKLFFLTIRQWCSGWSVVDGVINSRYVQQMKIALPEGLSMKAKKSYLHLNQAQLMQLESEAYDWQYEWVANVNSGEIDAVWLMAFPKNFDQELVISQLQHKRVIRRLCCDWQCQLSDLIKKAKHQKQQTDGLVACFQCNQVIYFIAQVKNKIIHIERLQYAFNKHWLTQQYEALQARVKSMSQLSYVCSANIYQQLAEDHKEQWCVDDAL